MLLQNGLTDRLNPVVKEEWVCALRNEYNFLTIKCLSKKNNKGITYYDPLGVLCDIYLIIKNRNWSNLNSTLIYETGLPGTYHFPENYRNIDGYWALLPDSVREWAGYDGMLSLSKDPWIKGYRMTELIDNYKLSQNEISDLIIEHM